jgi:hypothetical protein
VSSVGERAFKAIKRKAYPQKPQVELERIGIEYATWSNWRHGERNPSAYCLQQMARYGYDIYYILLGETKYEN